MQQPGNQQIHIQALLPPSWVAENGEEGGAHVVIQTEGKLLKRVPLNQAPPFSCPSWEAAPRGVCPEISQTKIQCTKIEDFDALQNCDYALPCPIGADEVLGKGIDAVCNPRAPVDWCPGDTFEDQECAKPVPKLSCFSNIVIDSYKNLSSVVSGTAGLLCGPGDIRTAVCECPVQGECLNPESSQLLSA